MWKGCLMGECEKAVWWVNVKRLFDGWMWKGCLMGECEKAVWWVNVKRLFDGWLWKGCLMGDCEKVVLKARNKVMILNFILTFT